MNISTVSDLFWSERIWLPPGVTWKMLEPTPEKPYANFSHLYFPILGAAIVMCIRFFMEKCVFRPWGLFLGIKPRRAKIDPEASAAIRAGPRALEDYQKKKDLSQRQVDRLLRRYEVLRKPETLSKFCETSWRCFFYTTMTFYGAWVLYDKPWTWNILNCWLGFPKHYITPDVWWYYMTELSFYWALMVSQFFDVKRKDFVQMFVHHCATIMLLSFSWACNLTRVGTLVLIVHDVADIFLEGAKMSKYAGKLTLCNFMFAVFTVTWIISRLGVFPFKIIYSVMTDGRAVCTFFPAFVFLVFLLIALLCLHVYWTKILLVQIVVALRSRGEMEKDVRSSSEAELTEDAEEEKKDS